MDKGGKGMNRRQRNTGMLRTDAHIINKIKEQ